MGKIMLNNVEYSGGSTGENITSDPTIITQAEYEALGDKVNSDNVVYYIKDGASDEVTLVTELNNTASDTEIPTAKAVYDEINDVNDSLKGTYKFYDEIITNISTLTTTLYPYPYIFNVNGLDSKFSGYCPEDNLQWVVEFLPIVNEKIIYAIQRWTGIGSNSTLKYERIYRAGSGWSEFSKLP